MTALTFLLVYYLGKPIFVSSGISERHRFFIALTMGLVLETLVFSYTGTTGYKLH